jgi:AbrB family looped-hinge helix DNA binding protein
MEVCIDMKIGERGQVTIPKELRERFGLLPNMEVEFVADEGGIRIQKRRARKSSVMDVFGILKKSAKTDTYMEEIRGR